MRATYSVYLILHLVNFLSVPVKWSGYLRRVELPHELTPVKTALYRCQVEQAVH
jgi:hypothetical protein